MKCLKERNRKNRSKSCVASQEYSHINFFEIHVGDANKRDKIGCNNCNVRATKSIYYNSIKSFLGIIIHYQKLGF